MKLYRASTDDFVTAATFFARRHEDALAYLDNPGYGGAFLYAVEVEVEDDLVLDIFELPTSAALDRLSRIVGYHPGAIGPEEWLGQSARLVDALVARGYHWVRVEDSYPDGCETWVWLGHPDGDEPEMETV